MKKSISTLFIESVVVGIGSLILFLIVLVLLSYIKQLKDNHPVHMAVSVFVSGMIFHLICEVSGVNIWYSKKYCELLQKTN
jgi:RsiW-degrading membrane proteinase PrsW (M82 family)